jgi:hypothetical protein
MAVEIAAFLIGAGIGLLIGYFTGWWHVSGRAYGAGYTHGQEDQIPIGGSCGSCGWEAPVSDSIMEMVETAMNHAARECPARH